MALVEQIQKELLESSDEELVLSRKQVETIFRKLAQHTLSGV